MMIIGSIALVPAYAGYNVIVEVRDSITGDQLPFATITNTTVRKKYVAGQDGIVSIPAKDRDIIDASYLGYEHSQKEINTAHGDTLLFLISPVSVDLQEVEVKVGKQKYSKKNNPAVDLLRRVRNDYEIKNPERQKYYSYDSYSKMVLGLNNFHSELKGHKGVLSQAIDTAAWNGSRILLLSLKEKESKRLFSHDPTTDKEIVRHRRSVGIDELLPQRNINVALEDVLREINPFERDIILMQNRFVSPLSGLGEDYYKYEITDTVMVGKEMCTEISFAPHNPESFSFNGHIYVADGSDSTVYIRRISMRVPKRINLNYVNNLYVSQNFEEDTLGMVHKNLDDVTVELQLLPNTPVLYGRRVIAGENFSFDRQQTLEKHYGRGASIVELYKRPEDEDAFWDAYRLVPLTRAEASMPAVMTGLRKWPLFYYAEKVIRILEGGYIKTSLNDSKWDFGPVNTLASFNSAEGLRLRIGGMTTANLNKRLFGRGYVAYGFKDRKWKYEGELEYSFNDKEYHSREFPRHSLLLSHSYDIDMLGQHYLFTNADNIFLSIKRRESFLATYRRRTRVEYLFELPLNFSVLAGLRHDIQESTRWVPFRYSDGRSISQLTEAVGSLTLRYAPDEKFTQGRTNRAPVNMDGIILQLTHEFGPRDVLGSSYTLNRTEVSMQKRWWFSSFGYTDIILKAGKIWSTVQFTSLLWPNSNLSYTIQPESYSLMNPMEFANDQYASVDLTYWGAGVLFNRIPFLKKLKMREVATFKGLVGDLSKRNNPEYNDALLRFPTEAGSRVMGRTPYMEAGIGLDNILTVLRVDYVWRLTYRGVPGIDRSGLRIALHFSF